MKRIIKRIETTIHRRFHRHVFYKFSGIHSNVLMIKFIFSKVADLKPKAHSLDEKNTTKKIASNKTFFYMRIIKAEHLQWVLTSILYVNVCVSSCMLSPPPPLIILD